MNSYTFWKEKLAGYAQESWAKHPSIFVQQAASYFPPGAKVLELTGGQGQDSLWLASQGYNVTYSDLVSDVVENMRVRTAAIPNLTCATVDVSNALPFPPESFDAVHSHLGLHYFDRQKNL